MKKRIAICFIIMLLTCYLPYCIKLVYGEYEDYTTYTEVDEDSDITISENQIDVSSIRRDANSYVIKDYGEDFFTGDFEYMFDFYVDWGFTDCEGGFFTLANDVGAYDTISGNDFITVFMYKTSANYIFVRERYSGSTNQANTGYSFADDTWWYCNVSRTSNVFRVDVYYDSDRTSLRSYCQITLNNVDDYRYVYVMHGSSSGWKPDTTCSYSLAYHDFGLESEPDLEPYYNNAGDNGETTVGETLNVFCNWSDDYNLDTCYFSTNTSGVWSNSSLTVSGVNSWANTSLTLNYTYGIVVSYKWYCSDNASQWNTTLTYNVTTTSLNMTFYFNYTDCSFFVDGITRTNGTILQFNYNQTVSLMGVTYNSTYNWLSFNATGYNLTTNPNSIFAVTEFNNVWCYFGLVGSGSGEYTEDDFETIFSIVIILIVVLLTLFTVFLINEKQKRR